MKRFIKSIFKHAVDSYYRYNCYHHYASQFKRYLKMQGLENKKAIGEDEYLEKWKVLCPRVEPYSYRFFRHYCGNTPNIVPEDIGHSYIETALNPSAFRLAYSDKTLFPIIIGKEYVPRTILCRINNSCLLDSDFCKIDMELSCYVDSLDALILKPSIGTCSGRGVQLFHKSGDQFVSQNQGFTLSKEYLLSYGGNFCLQETVRQHEFMSKLCPTSVNTIRLCLYRSVKDEKCHVTSSVIRIGKNGSFLDNAHAGGMFVGVNLQTGELGKYVTDQCGSKRNIWNSIDFASNTYHVPFWDNIISFAVFVGRKIPHHRLIALDIALRYDGNPILIEYNINSFSYWLFMLTGQEVFGEYTDEIIQYCMQHLKEKKKLV